MTKSNSRLRQQCSKLCNIVVGILSLAPCYVRKKQVRDKGVPSSYHHGKAVSSLVDDCQIMHPPPALFRKGEDGRKKKREVLHLFRCYTHTCTCTSTLFSTKVQEQIWAAERWGVLTLFSIALTFLWARIVDFLASLYNIYLRCLPRSWCVPNLRCSLKYNMACSTNGGTSQDYSSLHQLISRHSHMIIYVYIIAISCNHTPIIYHIL